MSQGTLELWDCDRCGFTYSKDKLLRQRGLLLCCDCRDDTKKIEKPNTRWMSARDNSTTTTAVNTPTIFTITSAGGVTSLQQSREYDHEGSRRVFHMHVVSDGGAITITAAPQIVSGLQGDILTLFGTSNTNTIQINDTGSVRLLYNFSMVLEKDDSITFVYNSSGLAASGWGGRFWGSADWGDADTGWVETSRTKGGF